MIETFWGKPCSNGDEGKETKSLMTLSKSARGAFSNYMPCLKSSRCHVVEYHCSCNCCGSSAITLYKIISLPGMPDIFQSEWSMIWRSDLHRSNWIKSFREKGLLVGTWIGDLERGMNCAAQHLLQTLAGLSSWIHEERGVSQNSFLSSDFCCLDRFIVVSGS